MFYPVGPNGVVEVLVPACFSRSISVMQNPKENPIQNLFCSFPKRRHSIFFSFFDQVHVNANFSGISLAFLMPERSENVK